MNRALRGKQWLRCIGSCCLTTSAFQSLASLAGHIFVRSAERHDMLVPSTRTQLGRRSFHVAAPAVWNALPPHLRSPSISRGQFRVGLKTHLFTLTYGLL